MSRKTTIAAVFALLASLLVTAVASAQTQTAPANTAPPDVSGTPRVGQTLSTTNGTWTNSPTSYAYQWQRCTSSTVCADITGATHQTYRLAAADSGHTMRSVVTASNADGKTSTPSAMTAVVQASGGPVNTSPPFVVGDAVVGQQLSADNGTWTGTPTFTYQWQRCTALGSSCISIPGSTTNGYTVASTDLGFTLRVRVTGHNSAGSAAAFSDVTSVVTLPARVGNRAPTISFISLRRVGVRVYARFRVCDDTAKPVTVFERDSKPGVLSYGRRFRVTPSLCIVATRNWILAPRFRTKGRFTVTLQAVDQSRAGSRAVHRTLVNR
jgi:hypothetical protein